MIRLMSFAKLIHRSRRGATLPEFAIILVPFLILIMGTMDMGYQAYLRATVTGAVERAARRATVGNYTQAEVRTIIRDEVNKILPNSARNDANAVVVTPLSYNNFSAVGGGERITGDTAPVGVYNSTDCYEDRNGNGRYDATDGGGANLGTADDIVYYQVTATAPKLFPIWRLMGAGSTTAATARTLVRNQPYGAQQIVIRCS